MILPEDLARENAKVIVDAAAVLMAELDPYGVLPLGSDEDFASVLRFLDTVFGTIAAAMEEAKAREN